MPYKKRTDTHCANGHNFKEVGLTIDSIGRWKCHQCARKYNIKRYEQIKSNLSISDFKLKHLRHNLKFFFSMTLDDYEKKLESQNYKCANTGCDIVHSSDNRLQVDHDHSCCNFTGRKTCGECIRGLLCRKCNLILGQSFEKVEYFLGLMEYLQIWNKSIPESSLVGTKTTSTLKEKKDGLGLDVVSSESTGIENYWDTKLKALPLDPTIFSSGRMSI